MGSPQGFSTNNFRLHNLRSDHGHHEPVDDTPVVLLCVMSLVGSWAPVCESAGSPTPRPGDVQEAVGQDPETDGAGWESSVPFIDLGEDPPAPCSCTSTSTHSNDYHMSETDVEVDEGWEDMQPVPDIPTKTLVHRASRKKTQRRRAGKTIGISWITTWSRYP